ncbi:hypothetical protein FRC11_010312 [Ceratobasidium sp. 423]|nr:hypothetical protein FRC11_010312 [Ceratobasidium sp. 423]
MSSTRRRTTSNNGRSHRHPINQSSKIKPQITLQRRIQSDLDTPQLPILVSPMLPITSFTSRKLAFGAVVTSLIIVYLLLRATTKFTATPYAQLADPTASGQPFPNAASLTPQGRIALQEFSLGSIQDLPSQVTFVFFILKHTARGALPLITRLQLLDSQIHILVPLSQAAEMDYLLDTILPARSNIRTYPSAIDTAGAALGMLHHAKHIKTPWVWIMSENHRSYLQDVEAWVDKVALKIPRMRIPTGMYGARLTEFGVSCVSSTDRAEPVAFLVPPFLAPTPLLVESEPGIIADTQANVWASLGERIGRITNLGMGGVVDKVLIVGGHDNGSRYNPVPKRRVCATAVIYLQDGDLESSEWLSMLTPEEWRAWDKPRIELAVITHDRPWSLRRLLDSVKQAHYFGDKVNVVINLEQTADQETRQIAEGFTMGPIDGHVAVRHRIVYAGLMTAVVESWYPHGNHSYGVMLEDDVELSPLFYAWIKFCVLRYRYGTPPGDASQLYGISLYQPKVTELHMQGRRPFNARDIFAMANIEHPHTPYLSQVGRRFFDP